ncbi:carboxypeptidase regulatory-like domain-containing protein [Crassaminicella thermophila]|uniref:Carboxypeptidase regulatory-like domain-containing protein n=1 Tax=Crassaminicella thermophila TaxID=2599308 RepID=A0A5C0SGD6_CRATE|nr:carboxypeptidase regulatory-like domain-containing protein [Crassaminicella thermophila]QEK13371.1 carboxypeptidase regulatory-like domain-containing protein [Crassaminicella thermophila]
MNRKVVLLIIGLFLLHFTVVFAHGAKITYEANMQYEIVAKYDDGTPMSDAQVIIYAPDDLKHPWKKDFCDKEGKYTFVADLQKKGTWTIQIRKAGHGGSIYIPIGEEVVESGQMGYTPIQKGIMAACVVWGFVGTGLYFSRRKK